MFQGKVEPSGVFPLSSFVSQNTWSSAEGAILGEEFLDHFVSLCLLLVPILIYMSNMAGKVQYLSPFL